ncbi:MAG TPA: CPBP family intramembrane glutamic endopeptidase [Candidatus Acidoferrales bacterium]|nr:CPBP family intramembrane glutamic endopeptidase [Candidatus Acidoferrales bacterium]
MPQLPSGPAAPLLSGAITPPGIRSAGDAPPPAGPDRKSASNEIFFGPNGLRAGWRLLIFAAIIAAFLTGLSFGSKLLSHGRPPQNGFSVTNIIVSESLVFLLFLIASWIMSRIEGRTIGDYGLPGRKAFQKQFWQGAIIGFAAMTILLGSLRAVGVFSFGTFALQGGELAKYAVLWGVAFLLVGFTEEFSVRGYALFTLTTGIGFWPAALLLSICFGALHLGNGGEDWLGALAAGSAGFLFCLILRRTGDLWMAIGFHAAWDWAETFFYGVPDSGQVAQGHMLNPSFHGSKLLTGGSVGPEGSVICFVILILCWLFFHFWLPEAKYPNPAAFGASSRGFELTDTTASV